jgi:hypothetical protein
VGRKWPQFGLNQRTLNESAAVARQLGALLSSSAEG